jgi:hypothetical protein
MFTKEEVAYIGDLAHDLGFEDYCEDEGESRMMDEIKRAAYRCTSDCKWVRDKELNYWDFASQEITQEHFDLLFRCLTYRAKQDLDEREESIFKKMETFCVFRPTFSKKEFLKLWQEVQELTVRLKELER